MPTTPRQSRSQDPRREGAEDYDRFLSILRGELDRVIEPLQQAIDETRDDVKALRKETYTREIMDNKLNYIHEMLKEHGEDLKGIHNLIGNSGRELLERIGVIAGIAYALSVILPHFFH